MTQDKIKKIHRIYGWVLSAVLVIVGILVILSCLDIYNSGPQPYNASSISLRFQRISIPIYIGILGIVGGIILNLLFPLPCQRAKSLITARDNMLRMRQKVSAPPVQTEINRRLILKIITTILFVALMIYPAIYCSSPNHFAEETANRDVLIATIITIGSATIGLALCFCCQLMLNASYRRETAIYKQTLANGQRTEKEEQISTCRIKRHWVQIAVAAVAITLVIIGIFSGDAEDVLTKAVAICTECIGLG